MMAYNFPDAPTLGQTFNQWTWDGEKWVMAGSTGTPASAITFTPTGNIAANNTQAAIAEVDSEKVAKAGDVMTGALTTPAPVLPVTTWTAAQQLSARQAVYAAPIDALAYNGMQINGNMDILQDGSSGALVTAVSRYSLDCWRAAFVHATATFSFAQNTTVGGWPHTNGHQLQCGTPMATLGAGEYVNIHQRIEGTRCARLAFGMAFAQPVTIAFWIYASVPGTMTVCVQNGAGDRSYLVPVTVSAASSWEYKTVTVPGDITGTWLKDTGIGMIVRLVFASGTTFQGTPNTWLASAAMSSNTATNFFANASNFVVVTGFLVLPGSEAPPKERAPFIMRSADQELLLCQRYYAKSYNQGTNPGTLTTQGAMNGTQTSVAGAVQYFPIILPAVMRTNIAAATIYNPQVANSQVRNLTMGSDWTGTAFWGQGDRYIAISSIAPAGSAVGQSSSFHWVVDGRL